MSANHDSARYRRLPRADGDDAAMDWEDGEFEAAWLAPVEKGVRLHFFGGSHDGCYVEIDKAGDYAVGCDEDAWFVCDKNDPIDAMVSRRHARITVSQEGVTVFALKPTNGLYLFSLDIPPGRGVPLRDGDLLRLGRGGPRIGVRIGDLSCLL